MNNGSSPEWITVEKLQVRQRDVSPWYHCDIWPTSLAQEPESHLCPLHCFKEGEKTKERKREKFYIDWDVTHTHTHLTFFTSSSTQGGGGSFKDGAHGWQSNSTAGPKGGVLSFFWNGCSGHLGHNCNFGCSCSGSYSLVVVVAVVAVVVVVVTVVAVVVAVVVV